jgi:hypothetical protein
MSPRSEEAIAEQLTSDLVVAPPPLWTQHLGDNLSDFGLHERSTAQLLVTGIAEVGAEGAHMTDSITLLRAGPNKSLAKIWATDEDIIPAAKATWFEGKEIPVASVQDICLVLDIIERRPRVALVKEAIARGVDVNRLRRRCSAGVDEYTGEPFPAGLMVVPRAWIVLDIEKLPRPSSIDFDDGAGLANYARDRLPVEFKPAACVWQLSGSSGHASRLDEIRVHLFFMLNEAVFPATWKGFLARSKIIDPSAFDKAKLIFTAAPISGGASDPIAQRHGVLSGEPTVVVPMAVIQQSHRIASGTDTTNRPPLVAPSAPMPEVAAAFTEIIAKSNILRSRHDAYCNDRARRLAFCAVLKDAFGIVDERALAQAFRDACVGDDDANGEHDVQQAAAWAANASTTGRTYSARKLLCDAFLTLGAAGEVDTAARAARLATVFSQLENCAA